MPMVSAVKWQPTGGLMAQADRLDRQIFNYVLTR